MYLGGDKEGDSPRAVRPARGRPDGEEGVRRRPQGGHGGRGPPAVLRPVWQCRLRHQVSDCTE